MNVFDLLKPTAQAGSFPGGGPVGPFPGPGKPFNRPIGAQVLPGGGSLFLDPRQNPALPALLRALSQHLFASLQAVAQVEQALGIGGGDSGIGRFLGGNVPQPTTTGAFGGGSPLTPVNTPLNVTGLGK